MKKSIAFILLILLSACSVQNQSNSGIQPNNNTVNIISQDDSVDDSFPIFVGEWEIGHIHDIAWNSTSTQFAANYYVYGENGGPHVLAVNLLSDIETWEVDDSLSSSLLFTNTDHYLIEVNCFAPKLYFRDPATGGILNSFSPETSCNGGGQMLIKSQEDGIIYSADWNDLLGLNTNHMVRINRWNLNQETCEQVILYQGSFDLFDINSSGTRLVYGETFEDNGIVVWDTVKGENICSYPADSYGQFLPGTDTLLVLGDQKINFIDSTVCEELRSLPIQTIGNNLAISSQGNQIATVDKEIEIHDLASSELLMTIPVPENASVYDYKLFHHGLVFSPDGKYIVAGFLINSEHGLLQLWQIQPDGGID